MKARAYVDTSVIGGCLDEEFAQESQALLEMARQGDVLLLVSELLIEELAEAPPKIRRLLAELPASAIELIELNDEAAALQSAYLKDKVVGRRQANDALHVALATVARADVILSWNFKHLVHLDKIKRFNAVNLREGYGLIEIRSPKEFV